MKKFSLALLAMATALAIAPAALADTVTYSTASDWVNTSAISFTGISSATVGAPTYSSLGTFALSGGSATYTNTPFDLTITQTVPSSGGGTFTSTISGTVTGNSSSAIVTFNQDYLTIGTTTYTLTEGIAGSGTYSYTLNGDTGSPGSTTVEADIKVTPEPSSLLLLGTGLLGLAFVAFRKAKSSGMVLSM